MNQMTTTAGNMPAASTVEDVVARGDLSKLTPEQRVMHYYKVCETLGLNPNTQPFQYITLSGKLVLYAKRDAADQLRKINGINLAVVGHKVQGELLTVHVKATDKSGRQDEDFGVVSVAGLRGEAAANAFLKAVTKAKRRVTLSISGLGFADESEVEAFGEPVLMPSMSQNERTEMIEEQHRQAAAQVTAPGTNEQAEPAQPHELQHDTNRGTTEMIWSEWATRLIAYIRAADSADAINAWTNANATHLSNLEHYDAEKHRRLVRMIDHQIAIRSEQQDEPR